MRRPPVMRRPGLAACRRPAASARPRRHTPRASGDRSISACAPRSPSSAVNSAKTDRANSTGWPLLAAIARDDDRLPRLAPPRDHRAHDAPIDPGWSPSATTTASTSGQRRDAAANRRRQARAPTPRSRRCARRVRRAPRERRRLRCRRRRSAHPSPRQRPRRVPHERNAVERRDELLRPERRAPPAASSSPAIISPPARATSARRNVSSGSVAHLTRPGGGSPSSDACIQRASIAAASLTRMPRTCSVSTDADAMHSAHASAVNARRRSSRRRPHLHANAIAAQRIRPLGRAFASASAPRLRGCRKCSSTTARNGVTRHARFPLRTATISARIDSATSAGALPPMSRPIGVCTRASSSSVKPSSRSSSRTAAPRFLLPSMPR